MDTTERHSIWELNVSGFDTPILASTLLDTMASETSNSVVSQSLLKSYIGNSAIDGQSYVKCGECGCPLQLVAGNATSATFFRHDVNKAHDPDNIKDCAFYSKNSTFFGPGDIYKGEGHWHFESKHWIAELLKANPVYKNVEVEKFIFSKSPEIDERRRPDIAFEDSNGNSFAIELTRWWMSPEVVAKRERFFRSQSINLIWLFSPDCEEFNGTTFNLILFGSPSSRVEAVEHNVLAEVECNAFVLSKAAKLKTVSKRELFFEVRYPKARVNVELQSIEFDIESEMCALSEASLNPTERLPFVRKTSTSFKKATDELAILKRKTKASFLITLRKMAYSKVSGNTVIDDKLFDTKLLKNDSLEIGYRFTKTVTRYQELVKKKCAEAEVLYHTQKARRQAATDVNKLRNNINRLIKVSSKARNLRNIEVGEAQLKSLISSSSRYQSDVVLARLKTAENKLAAKRAEFSKPGAMTSSNSVMTQEMFSFIDELEKGFTGLVQDPSALHIKATRISGWARRNRFNHEADLIPKLVKQAILNAEESYCKLRYPNLSQGWKPELFYKEELEKAIRLVNMDLVAKKRGQRNLTVEQLVTEKLLGDFSEQVESVVIETCDIILYREPATVSSFLSKSNKHLKQIVALTKYIKANTKYSKMPLDAEFDVILYANQLFTEGVGINQIQRQSRDKYN